MLLEKRIQKINSLERNLKKKCALALFSTKKSTAHSHLDHKTLKLNVNESRYKQCGVTRHLSTRQKLLKNILQKDKY